MRSSSGFEIKSSNSNKKTERVARRKFRYRFVEALKVNKHELGKMKLKK
jgi:hypothetical protein